jgi:hypothetical protein
LSSCGPIRVRSPTWNRAYTRPFDRWRTIC